MHWCMSMSSATQASAHELQIAAQYIACLNARPSASLGSRLATTSGCSAIIFSIDMGVLLSGEERTGGGVVPPPVVNSEQPFDLAVLEADVLRAGNLGEARHGHDLAADR